MSLARTFKAGETIDELFASRSNAGDHNGTQSTLCDEGQVNLTRR